MKRQLLILEEGSFLFLFLPMKNNSSLSSPLRSSVYYPITLFLFLFKKVEMKEGMKGIRNGNEAAAWVFQKKLKEEGKKKKDQDKYCNYVPLSLPLSSTLSLLSHFFPLFFFFTSSQGEKEKKKVCFFFLSFLLWKNFILSFLPSNEREREETIKQRLKE